MEHTLTLEEAEALAVSALTTSGAGPAAAASVARAVVDAHNQGRTNVGFEHLPCYCDALRRGAVDGGAEPDIEEVKPGLLQVDARLGFTHHAFDQAFEAFATMADRQGVAVLTLRRTYTCGCLGYFPARLAGRGFAAIAATNAGPAITTPSGATCPVFSTNPLACAFPRRDGPPLLIDQSSSACTLVDVHRAREHGKSIPRDWALDAAGRPTTDPDEALGGSFRPFGGYRGSNIALMVELLAAGLSGSNWSVDAPSFDQGPECPGVGQWFLAMRLDSMSNGAAGGRIDAYLNRIAAMGTHIPGDDRQRRAACRTTIVLPDALYQTIQSFGGTT